MNIQIKDIASAMEQFAPLSMQEDYDNSGLQIGSPSANVESVLLCLSVTEDIIKEAARRGCNLIVSHHPLFFKGLKHITGATAVERIAMEALRADIGIYSAHTNLDNAYEGVSYEMAHALGMTDMTPLVPTFPGAETGTGIIGEMSKPVPALEFLRQLQTTFSVKALRYSTTTPKIVIRKVALCGGSGAPFIKDAIAAGADAYVSGDIKYHDFDSYGPEILLADVGHFESEIASKKILARILKNHFPTLPVFPAETECNPVGLL